MASLFALVGYNLRRLRLDGSAPWVLGGVVLLAAFGTAATPRFLNSVSDDALHTAVSAARPRARNIIIEQGLRIPVAPGDDVFAGVARLGQSLAEDFPEPLQRILSQQRYVVDTQTFEVAQFPGDTGDPPVRVLRLRYQEGIEEQITVTEGNLPAPVDPLEVDFDDDASPIELPVLQIGITPETARLMQLGVGDRVVVSPQRRDPLTVGVPSNQLSYQLVIEISGIINVVEPDAEYWMSDRGLHQPSLDTDAANPDAVTVFATGLIGPDDYQRLLSLSRPVLWNYTWRFFVDPDLFDAGDVSAIDAGLQDLQLELGSPARAGIDEPRLTTGLERIFESYSKQRALTVSILSLALAGLVSLVFAVTTLLGALTARRRRAATTLARSRGASGRQLGSALLLEGIIVFLPFAVLGYLLAKLTVDAREPGLVFPLIMVGVVGVAAILVALALPLLRGDLGELLGDETPGAKRSNRRLVMEGLLATSSIGGLFLFRRRGLQGGGIADQNGEFDPLLAAVPVLLALAFGVVLLRFYPLLVRAWGRYGTRRRDVVSFVGLRRLRRQSITAQLPLPVTLLAIGIAIFGAVLVNSISENREILSWQSVGADYLLESLRTDEPLSASLDMSEVPGIEATADLSVLSVRLGGATASSRPRVSLVALDIAAYDSVTNGTPADPGFPDSMVTPQIGSEGPIPAVVSSTLPGLGLTTGQVLIVEGPRQVDIPILVLAARDEFPGFAAGEPFIILDRAGLEAAAPAFDLRPTRKYIRAPVTAAPALSATVQSQSGGTRVISRVELLTDLIEAPLVKAVDDGYRLAVVLATLFAVLAALAAIALTATERTRDFGFLRTLGLSSGQVTALTVVEQLPWALIATASGIGFALGLTWLVEPGLDLGPFTGGEATIGIFVDWGTVLLVAGTVLISLMVATALYSYRAHRVNLGSVLRIGDHG